MDGTDQDHADPHDYRWIIEEDRTFYIDPNCRRIQYRGLPDDSVLRRFGTNFHTSYMPVVAQGCTGRLSCESGQTGLARRTAPRCAISATAFAAPDATQQTPVLIPARSLSIRPSATTSRFCRAMRDRIRGHAMGGSADHRDRLRAWQTGCNGALSSP